MKGMELWLHGGLWWLAMAARKSVEVRVGGEEGLGHGL